MPAQSASCATNGAVSLNELPEQALLLLDTATIITALTHPTLKPRPAAQLVKLPAALLMAVSWAALRHPVISFSQGGR